MNLVFPVRCLFSYRSWRSRWHHQIHTMIVIMWFWLPSLLARLHNQCRLFRGKYQYIFYHETYQMLCEIAWWLSCAISWHGLFLMMFVNRSLPRGFSNLVWPERGCGVWASKLLWVILAEKFAHFRDVFRNISTFVQTPENFVSVTKRHMFRNILQIMGPIRAAYTGIWLHYVSTPTIE